MVFKRQGLAFLACATGKTPASWALALLARDSRCAAVVVRTTNQMTLWKDFRALHGEPPWHLFRVAVFSFHN
jgi:hypothetical protein